MFFKTALAVVAGLLAYNVIKNVAAPASLKPYLS